MSGGRGHSRRAALAAIGGAGTLAARAAWGAGGQTLPAATQGDPRANFQLAGTYLNAAYSHPLPLDAAAAARAFLDSRVDPSARREPARGGAKALFARLINASESEIAAIPSTSYGESFVAAALGLFEDRKAGIVSDILHFEGGLYMYGELAKQGNPFRILPMEADGRIDMNRLEDAMKPGTRLIAISLVSMVNGFHHDLKTVCEIAHRRGARVFVDAVQAAGAVPIDVRETGVDFLACSSFKWLQGDFGYGFLYCRGDLIPTLPRRQYGYHQIARLAYHAMPGDASGGTLFEAEAQDGTATGRFEAGSLSLATEAAVSVSLANILAAGVPAIAARRASLMERLYAGLGGRYRLLSPARSASPIVTFALPDTSTVIGPKLREAGVTIQVYRNRFRISPSIYNDMADVEKLIAVLG